MTTTTNELREALNSVDPAFPGVEIDAIVHRAHRIRRRNRIAGAAMATVAVVGGFATVSQLHPTLPDGGTGAALPPLASVPGGRVPRATQALLDLPLRPKTTALPAVDKVGQPVPIDGDVKGWLAPPIQGNDDGQFCYGDPDDPNLADCMTLVRSASGTLWSHNYPLDDAGQLFVFVVDGRVAAVQAADNYGVEQPVTRDLGQGYVLVTATVRRPPPAPLPLAEVLVALDGSGQVIARMGHVESRADRQSRLDSDRINGVPKPLPVVDGEGKHVTIGLEDYWVAPSSDEKSAGQLCSVEVGRAGAKADCDTIVSPNTARISQSELGLGDGRIEVTILTSAPVAKVRAVRGNTAIASGTTYELGHGYRLVTVTLLDAGESPLQEIRGYASDEREVLRSPITSVK